MSTRDRVTIGLLVVVAILLTQTGAAFAEDRALGIVLAEGEFREQSGDPPSAAGEQGERLFPLWKELADGYEDMLPPPYGVAGVLNWLGSGYSLVKADLSLNDEPLESVDLTGSDVTTSAYVAGVKGDLWLFPFLNVFATVGKTEVDALVTLANVPNGIGGLPPEVQYGDVFMNLNFSGWFYALGTVVSGGHGNVFIVADFVYAVQKLDAESVGLDDDDVKAFTSAPRLGYHIGSMEVWIGGRYLSIEQNFSGTVAIEENTLNYDVKIDQADWHYLMGMHALLHDHWDVVVEGGIGVRNSVVMSVGYRW